MLAFGEYRPDVSDYQAQHIGTAHNVVPRGDGYGPFQDFAALTAALPAACRGGIVARKSDGSVVVFAGTSTRLYMLDNTDLAWDDVSAGGSAYTTLDATANWSFAQHGNYIIAVQDNIAPQKFVLGSSSAFEALGGSPPNAAYVSIVGRFVVLSGLASNPFRVQWSGLNAPETWTQGTNQSDYQDLPDGGVVRRVAGGEAGVIFQDSAIRRMTYAVGSPLIFQIERITEDMGIYAPESLVRSGDRLFFLAAHGFHYMTPNSYPEAIGMERVDRTFFTDLDRANLQLLIGASDPRQKRVYWAYKSASGSSGLFDKILCFDWGLGRWSTISTHGEYLTSLSQPGLTLENMDLISSSIDDFPGSFDDYVTTVAPEMAVFNSSHVLGFFRGDHLEATLDTAEHAEANQMIYVNGFRPITDAEEGYGSLMYRNNRKGTSTQTTETEINDDGFCPQNQSARYARARLRIPSAVDWSYATGVEPDASPDGER